LRRLVLLLAALTAVFFAGPAWAHEVRPAYLEIREDAPSRYTITWKQPVVGDMAIRLVPRLSNGWLDAAPADDFISPAFRIRTWQVRSAAPDPITGQTVLIEGLDRSITDALVSVRLADGRSFETILNPGRSSVRLTFGHAGGLIVPAYFALGVEHILTGIDHLMFVLALVLLVGIRWRLLTAITAFTVAHSITLAASATGLVHVPSAVIEALVALSIVVVAVELMNAQRGEGGLTLRHPWLIAFTFGLLHGFAFAGALVEVGLPKDAIAQSLLLFNVGVETGQILFVGMAIMALMTFRPLRLWMPSAWDRLGKVLPPYAIGSFAAFWFIERTAAAVS
jgi:hydrogenase/urease accessory protein HupE